MMFRQDIFSCLPGLCRIASSTIARVSPWILISIWIAVIPVGMRAGNLKVHIFQRNLLPWISAQDEIIVIRISGYKSAGNACHILLDRNAGSRFQGP